MEDWNRPVATRRRRAAQEIAAAPVTPPTVAAAAVALPCPLPPPPLPPLRVADPAGICSPGTSPHLSEFCCRSGARFAASVVAATVATVFFVWRDCAGNPAAPASDRAPPGRPSDRFNAGGGWAGLSRAFNAASSSRQPAPLLLMDGAARAGLEAGSADPQG
jgi:hypothetical protein